jgi:hypothetical protein
LFTLCFLVCFLLKSLQMFLLKAKGVMYNEYSTAYPDH